MRSSTQQKKRFTPLFSTLYVSIWSTSVFSLNQEEEWFSPPLIPTALRMAEKAGIRRLSGGMMSRTLGLRLFEKFSTSAVLTKVTISR